MADIEIPRQMITRIVANDRRLALLCLCAVAISGCATRRTPAKPVVNFVAAVHPVVPAATSTALESPPDVAVALREPPKIEPSQLQPARPHVVAPVEQEPRGTEKHAEPTIAPEVTTEEIRTAQAETQRNLDIAEKNLLLAQGKGLNAMQTDMVSKVKGFVENAREAMRSGDWVRAKNFASKAEVLSEQLAASF